MKKKIAMLNVSVSVLYQILGIVFGLILPKLYIETFGSTYNGLNQTIAQMMKFLAVLQLGIGAATIQALFKPVVKKDKSSINDILNHTDKEYKKMGYIFVVIFVIVAFVWGLNSKEQLPVYIIPLFLCVYGFSSSMGYFYLSKYDNLLIASNRNYIIYLINIVLLTLGSILKILVLLFFKHIVIYLFILVIITLLRMIIIKVYIGKEFPYLSKSNIKKKLEIKPRKDVLINELAGFVINSTDLLVLTFTCGLVAASIYSVYNYVTSSVKYVSLSVKEGMFAGLGQSYHENFDYFKIRFSQFEVIFFSVIFLLFSITILLYMPFIKIYTKNMDVDYVNKFFPAMFVIMSVIGCLKCVAGVAIVIVGHFKEVRKFSIAEAAINLIVSIILAKFIGIYGVLIGSIIAGAYSVPVLINYANRRIINQSNLESVKRLFILSIPFWFCLWGSLYFDVTFVSFLELVPFALIVVFVLLIIYSIILYFLEKKLVVSESVKIFIIIKKQLKRVL